MLRALERISFDKHWIGMKWVAESSHQNQMMVYIYYKKNRDVALKEEK